MNELLFLGVFNFSILMTVLTVVDDEIAWPILAFASWITCAAAVHNLERPYVYLSSGVPTESTISYGSPFLMVFFLGIAVVFIALVFNRVFEVWEASQTKGGGRGG